MYYRRIIDKKLLEWKDAPRRKPLLIRGARQVGKSTAVRQLAKQFKYFVEMNLERQPSIRQLFTKDIDVKRTCETISVITGIPIVTGETLLFIDEIQVSQEAIMSLRYFKEDFPDLHVIAAGSLLEFALQELPSFGVGRIRSMYMYPFSFDEFLLAQGLDSMVEYKRRASAENPLPQIIHEKLTEHLKTFYLVGGMPAAITEWMETKSYQECVHVHNDILDTYQDDFAKYRSRVSPALLRKALKSVALQAGSKFVYSQVDRETRTYNIKEALHLLTLAGVVVPVVHTDGNGLPLGAEANENFTKYLFLDLGLMQTLLGTPAAEILLASDLDLVNKGAASEMFAGLELVKYHDCLQRAELHYWQNLDRGTNAEIDYLEAKDGKVLPIEVKAQTRGSMQSLWVFMHKKGLKQAIRTSLENFGQLDYTDKEDNCSMRHVDIIPLYALSNLQP